MVKSYPDGHIINRKERNRIAEKSAMHDLKARQTREAPFSGSARRCVHTGRRAADQQFMRQTRGWMCSNPPRSAQHATTQAGVNNQ